jgi:putative ABC transport system ATP-binding protein
LSAVIPIFVVIQLEGVIKTHGEGGGKVTALQGIDLKVQAGEFVSVMGPSGCGKSTLLNMISALDRATSGKVIIEGQDISQLTDDQLTNFRRQKLGLVFQFFNLMPTLNALDNVLLPVMLERKPAPADHERAKALLKEVGLERRATHRTFEMSGGEMQRVAIARSLVLEPRLLLADEPTGNLDSNTTSAILSLLRSLNKQRGLTIVMVTHDRNAANYGDRLVHLKDGKILREEAISATVETPQGQAAVAR